MNPNAQHDDAAEAADQVRTALTHAQRTPDLQSGSVLETIALSGLERLEAIAQSVSGTLSSLYLSLRDECDRTFHQRPDPRRRLHFEDLEGRLLMANDLGDISGETEEIRIEKVQAAPQISAKAIGQFVELTYTDVPKDAYLGIAKVGGNGMIMKTKVAGGDGVLLVQLPNDRRTNTEVVMLHKVGRKYQKAEERGLRFLMEGHRFITKPDTSALLHMESLTRTVEKSVGGETPGMAWVERRSVESGGTVPTVDMQLQGSRDLSLEYTAMPPGFVWRIIPVGYTGIGGTTVVVLEEGSGTATMKIPRSFGKFQAVISDAQTGENVGKAREFSMHEYSMKTRPRTGEEEIGSLRYGEIEEPEATVTALDPQAVDAVLSDDANTSDKVTGVQAERVVSSSSNQDTSTSTVADTDTQSIVPPETEQERATPREKQSPVEEVRIEKMKAAPTLRAQAVGQFVEITYTDIPKDAYLGIAKVGGNGMIMKTKIAGGDGVLLVQLPNDRRTNTEVALLHPVGKKYQKAEERGLRFVMDGHRFITKPDTSALLRMESLTRIVEKSVGGEKPGMAWVQARAVEEGGTTPHIEMKMTGSRDLSLSYEDMPPGFVWRIVPQGYAGLGGTAVTPLEQGSGIVDMQIPRSFGNFSVVISDAQTGEIVSKQRSFRINNYNLAQKPRIGGEDLTVLRYGEREEPEATIPTLDPQAVDIAMQDTVGARRAVPLSTDSQISIETVGEVPARRAVPESTELPPLSPSLSIGTIDGNNILVQVYSPFERGYVYLDGNPLGHEWVEQGFSTVQLTMPGDKRSGYYTLSLRQDKEADEEVSVDVRWDNRAKKIIVKTKHMWDSTAFGAQVNEGANPQWAKEMENALDDFDDRLKTIDLRTGNLRLAQTEHLFVRSRFYVDRETAVMAMREPSIFFDTPEDEQEYLEDRARGSTFPIARHREALQNTQRAAMEDYHKRYNYYTQTVSRLLEEGMRMLMKLQNGEPERRLQEELKMFTGNTNTYGVIDQPTMGDVLKEAKRLLREEQAFLQNRQDKDELRQNGKAEEDIRRMIEQRRVVALDDSLRLQIAFEESQSSGMVTVAQGEGRRETQVLGTKESELIIAREEVATAGTSDGGVEATKEPERGELEPPVFDALPEISHATTIKLRWDVSTGFKSYNIYIFTADDRIGKKINIANNRNAKELTYTASDLVKGQTYFFGIKGVDNSDKLHTVPGDRVSHTFIYKEGAVRWNTKQPAQDAMAKAFKEAFPGNPVSTARVVRFARRLQSLSDHSTGRAVDLFLDAGDTKEKIQGDAFFAYLQAHHAEFGIEYLIWDKQIWTPSKGVQKYTYGHPHHDHIHITFTAAGSQKTEFDLSGLSAPIGAMSASSLSSSSAQLSSDTSE